MYFLLFLILSFGNLIVHDAYAKENERKVSNRKPRKAMQLTSKSFNHESWIPSRFTCEGKNISPQFSWRNVPKDTNSFVLICKDPDAPGKTWIHWVLFNIPATMRSLSEDQEITDPMKQGKNDFDKTSYGGPCPPPGHGKHRYIFTLYALDTKLNLSSGVTLDQVRSAMKDHILAEATFIGVYERK